MSRQYQMTVSIEGFDPKRRYEVMGAAEDESSIESIEQYTMDRKVYLYGCGEVSLRNAQTEKQYADEISRAVWIANRGYCEVKVTCCCLEDAPRYVAEESDYDMIADEIAEAIAEAIAEEERDNAATP